MKPTLIIPTMVPQVLERAGLILQKNGRHCGDYVFDPLNRALSTPHHTRTMDAVGALFCAVTNDPRTPSPLAMRAVEYVGARVLVDGEPAWGERYADLERHVHDWSDANSCQVVAGWLLDEARTLTARMAVAA